MIRKSATLLLASLALTSAAHAANIFSNDITDTNPSAVNPFTTGQIVDTHLTANGIGRGSGLNPNAGGNRYNATAWSTGGLDTSDYFTWTLAPNAGYELDLASLTYTAQRSGTGPNSFSLRSSVDGFASDIASPSATGGSLDLSSFQNLTSAVEFRFYGWGGTGASGTYSINDFTFDGALNAVSGGGASATLAASGSPTLGSVTITGADSTGYAFAKVAAAGATSGTLAITGAIASSTRDVLVYLDLADASSVLPDLGAGVTVSTVATSFGDGIVYDRLLTFASVPANAGSFYFSFDGLPAINNIAVVPEPTAAAAMLPATLLLKRRRRA